MRGSTPDTIFHDVQETVWLVSSTRLMIISKGKEQPFCTEENEACWQQNRRGHFIVTAK